jgi:hypothetical protein
MRWLELLGWFGRRFRQRRERRHFRHDRFRDRGRRYGDGDRLEQYRRQPDHRAGLEFHGLEHDE